MRTGRTAGERRGKTGGGKKAGRSGSEGGRQGQRESDDRTGWRDELKSITVFAGKVSDQDGDGERR